MPEYLKPTSSELAVWATDGEKDAPTLPEIEQGWEGGEIPPHEFFNWLQNKTDRSILYILQQGIPTWDPSFDYKANKSIVKGSTGSIFLSKVDSTGQNPDTDVTATYWKKLLDSTGAVAVGDISPYAYTLLEAVDEDDAQTILGATTVGKGVFNAVDEASARTAIGGDYFTNRANHTGSQPISSVTNLQTTLDAKEITTNKSTTLAGANDTTYPTTKAVADAISIAASGEMYKGEWDADANTPTLTSSVGTQGDYYRVSVAGSTNLNGITSWSLGDEAYFDGSVWLKRPNYFPSLTTDDISEATNLYFTASRVRGVVLTGISFVSSLAITATDTLIDALGKLQAQITSLFSRVPPSGGSSGQLLAKNSGADYDYTWVSPTTNSVVPVNNLGNRAVTGSETVNLDCSLNTEWNVSLNSSDTTGTLTLNLINIPSTTNGKYVGYIRVIRGGRKTIAVTVPAGKSWNWIQSAAPQWTNVAGEYDVVMFYIQLDEAKIHAMVVDTGVV